MIVSTVQGVIDSVLSIVDQGVAEVQSKWENLKSIFSSPINAVVNFIKGGDGEAASVASNATGGIYNKGAFLTTFAEEGPEAAIPLDGSQRAISLWTQAGQMLGMLPTSVSSAFAGQQTAQPQSAAPIAAPAPAGNSSVTFELTPNITVNGSGQEAVGDFKAALEEFAERFERNLPRMMESMQANQRRLSYG